MPLDMNVQEALSRVEQPQQQVPVGPPQNPQQALAAIDAGPVPLESSVEPELSMDFTEPGGYADEELPNMGMQGEILAEGQGEVEDMLPPMDERGAEAVQVMEQINELQRYLQALIG